MCIENQLNIKLVFGFKVIAPLLTSNNSQVSFQTPQFLKFTATYTPGPRIMRIHLVRGLEEKPSIFI